MTTEPESMLDLPPALPPKDSPSGKAGMRPPLLRLDTADIRRDTSDARRLDSEEPTDAPGSWPVEGWRLSELVSLLVYEVECVRMARRVLVRLSVC